MSAFTFSESTTCHTISLMIPSSCAFTFQFKCKKQQSGLSSRKTSITFRLLFAYKSVFRDFYLFLLALLLLKLSHKNPYRLLAQTSYSLLTIAKKRTDFFLKTGAGQLSDESVVCSSVIKINFAFPFSLSLSFKNPYSCLEQM